MSFEFKILSNLKLELRVSEHDTPEGWAIQ